MPAPFPDTEQLIALDKDKLVDQLDSFPEHDNRNPCQQADKGSGDNQGRIFTGKKKFQFATHVRSGISQPRFLAWRRKKSSVIPAR